MLVSNQAETPMGSNVSGMLSRGSVNTVETSTGPRRETQSDSLCATVSQAQQLEASGEPAALAEAAALYDEVLDSDPENVDALTYKGWLLVRALARAVAVIPRRTT